mgnify:CR=1 FL=1
MKDTFSSLLVDLAFKESNVLVLSGDHGYDLFNQLRESRSNQFINMGVAEQNMVGVAAGLARVGFRPIVYGLSAFVPIRVLEQIKLDVCHDGLPVIFVGDGAGFVYSQLGTSHQSTEDIAATRSIPGLIILSPGDRFEFERCFTLAYQAKLPVYLRLGKADRGDVHSKALTFNFGDLIELKKSTSENRKVALIATGSMLKMATMICNHFPELGLLSAPCLKPLNEIQVIELSKNNDLLITLEEHSIMGGLGSSIAEISSRVSHARLERLGVLDQFSKHCGSYEYLLKEHQLDFPALIEKVSSLLSSLK